MLSLHRSDIVLRHGGARNFARGCAYRVMGTLGLFRSLRKLDWSRINRLVFVCEGNICRSPFAEALSSDLGVRSASCGIKASGNAPAHPTARCTAKARGIDIDEHVSRNVTEIELAPTDLLVGFDPAHKSAIERLARVAQCQFTLLGLWLRPKRPLIADPFGRERSCFDHVFELIDEGTRALTANMRAQPVLNGVERLSPLQSRSD